MPDAPRGRAVLLATDCAGTRAVYHALTAAGLDVRVVLEPAIGKVTLLRGRARRYGLVTAAGQALFQLGVVPVLRYGARARVAEIRRAHGIDLSPIPGAVVTRIPSVNAPEAVAAVNASAPAVVVVSGTRIISRATLEGIAVPVINQHAGITPFYRGVHGAYWALADGRPDLVGTTIHYVDPGIDTGAIIEQRYFTVTAADDFTTYPELHMVTGLPALIAAAVACANGVRPPVIAPPDTPSLLRTHPTLWGYLARRLGRGVR